jgi:hypothetical protein
MGLGPPVCEKCRVIASLEAIRFKWHCKYCGNKDPQWNAWDCGLTEEELHENKLFLDFVKGTQDAPTSRRSNSIK